MTNNSQPLILCAAHLICLTLYKNLAFTHILVMVMVMVRMVTFMTVHVVVGLYNIVQSYLNITMEPAPIPIQYT